MKGIVARPTAVGRYSLADFGKNAAAFVFVTAVAPAVTSRITWPGKMTDAKVCQTSASHVICIVLDELSPFSTDFEYLSAASHPT